MNFYFSPDWITYADMIMDKAKKQGIDIDGAPFVTYMTTIEKTQKIERNIFARSEKD